MTDPRGEWTVNPLLGAAEVVSRAIQPTYVQMPTAGWQAIRAQCPFCSLVTETARNGLEPFRPGRRLQDEWEWDMVRHLLKYHSLELSTAPTVGKESTHGE
jgi:hypothetical protein